MPSGGTMIPAEEEPAEATLLFREQLDGRKVSRLPGGKVVLVDFERIDTVQDGERWRVRLTHRETYAIAEPLEKLRDLTNPVIPADVGAKLARALPKASAEARPAAAHPEAVNDAVAAPRPPAAVPTVPATGPAVSAPESTSRAAPAAPPGEEAGEREPTAVSPSQVIRAGERVALFVDGANMDGACRSAGYFIDYLKARRFLVAGGAFVAGYHYLADFTATDPLQLTFMDFLAHAGFIVRRRPVKVIRDEETGERIIKGNLDTEIVLDMLNTVDNYDVAFLLSGDSDFERAVELLRSRGKRIYVLTSRQALSRELMYVADKPIFYLEEFRDTLERDHRVRRGATRTVTRPNAAEDE